MLTGLRESPAALADSSDQAENHWANRGASWVPNVLLRENYPITCKQRRHPGGVTIADLQNLVWTEIVYLFGQRQSTREQSA